VDSKRPSEKRIEDFLDRQLSWVRKALHGQPLSWEETAALQQPGAFEILGKAQDEYVELLKLCPARLSKYRKLQGKLAVKSVLSKLPSVPPGAPRQDAVAQEAEDLQRAGMSQPKIARALNLRYPNRKDSKGNEHPFSAEAVRKMLARRKREIAPDKT
jgi:hypothetical protein